MPPVHSLAGLPPDALLTEAEAAAYLRIRPGALKSMRLRGRGPTFVRVGRAVRYGVAALRAFLAGPTADRPDRPDRPSRAPQFGAPFEPHTTGLRCRDGQGFVPVHFALGCPLAQAVDALMVETKADWLRATLPDMHAMLLFWGRSTRQNWPEDPATLAAALVAPCGQLGADLRRLGIVAERRDTDRGPALDLIRVATPSQRRRFPGQGCAR